MVHLTSLQRSALTISLLTSFLNPSLLSGVNIALPIVEHEFNLDAVSLSWIITSYLLASAVFLLPIGKFADNRGQKEVFKGGIIIFTIATVLCSIAPNGLLLIIFRIIQGLGAAMILTTGAPILVSVFPQTERGKVLGLNAAILIYMGTGFGIFSSPNMNTFMSSVERRQLGIASGTAATMRVIGQMISMMIVTLVFSFYFSGSHIKDVENGLFISSIRLLFIISGVICLTGVYFSGSRGNLRNLINDGSSSKF